MPLFHKKTAARFPWQRFGFFMGIYSYSTAGPPEGKQIMMPVIIISTGTIIFICKTPLNKGFGYILIFHVGFVNQNYSSICLIGKFSNQW